RGPARRLIGVVEVDALGSDSVDVCREGRGGIRNLRGGEGVQEPQDVHVRGVQVPLREVHEWRQITETRVIGIQVARATRGRDELIERTRGLVIDIEQRGREVHETRVQTTC